MLAVCCGQTPVKILHYILHSFAGRGYVTVACENLLISKCIHSLHHYVPFLLGPYKAQDTLPINYSPSHPRNNVPLVCLPALGY